MPDIEQRIFEIADQLVDQGELPSLERLVEETALQVHEVELPFARWTTQFIERQNKALPVSAKKQHNPPEMLQMQLRQIWTAALDEAVGIVRDEISASRVSDEEERRATQDQVRDSEARYRELERKYRDQTAAMEKEAQHVRTLEAEITVLKANLASETNQRKKFEQQRANVESELSQIRKQYEDGKKLFDQRIKEEQRQALEAVSRAEVEARHYRNALEKARDDAGRGEAELTRQVHELQAQTARKDARIDMQDATVSDLEKEVEQFKETLTSYSREIATLNSKLLREGNTARRQEAQIAELEEDNRRLNQRAAVSSNEQSKRENTLRQQIKERDEQLTRANARVNSLEKRITTQEDQIRRLNAKL
mgnify:FL=1